MRDFIKAFLVFLLWAIFAIVIHEYVSNSLLGDCATAHIEKEIPIVETPVEIDVPNLKIKDGNYLVFEFSENFHINSKDGNVFVPNSLSLFKDSIANYLNRNINKEVVVNSRYLKSESDPVNNDNFGLRRSENMKNILVSAGINSDRIHTFSNVFDYNYDANGKFYDGITIKFRDVTQEKLAEIEKSIANKTLYSKFAEKTFKPDPALQSYTLELLSYMKKYPTKKISVIGHTDNIGKASSNYQLGLQRAKNVADYLVSRGVAQSSIASSSKGQTNPIADNNTEQGRSKNRRIEILIK